MKGSVGLIGGTRSFAAARLLEDMGRRGELSGSNETLETLEREVGRLSVQLAKFGSGEAV